MDNQENQENQKNYLWKDKQKEYYKSYYENNKNKYSNQKIECSCCKKMIFKNSLNKHQQTAKCQLVQLQNSIKN